MSKDGLYKCVRCDERKPFNAYRNKSNGKKGRLALVGNCLACEQELRDIRETLRKEKIKRNIAAVEEAKKKKEAERQARELAKKLCIDDEVERKRRQAEHEARMDRNCLAARAAGMSYGQYIAMLRRKGGERVITRRRRSKADDKKCWLVRITYASNVAEEIPLYAETAEEAAELAPMFALSRFGEVEMVEPVKQLTDFEMLSYRRHSIRMGA